MVAAALIQSHDLAMPAGPRHYLVVRPDGAGNARLPAIVLLHGHGASAAWLAGQEAFVGFSSDEWVRLAQREHVLLLIPDGVKGSDDKRAWNDCRADAGTNAKSDDVRFIARMIDTAIAGDGADPDRGAPAGLQVELLRIDGGGHTWPSRTDSPPWLLRKLVGDMNHDVELTDELWAFFKDKRRTSRETLHE